MEIIVDDSRDVILLALSAVEIWRGRLVKTIVDKQDTFFNSV